MRIRNDLTDESVLSELGERLSRLRLQRNLTQAQLAQEAGIERKALLRLEAGEPVQLITALRVLRALGRLEALDIVAPEVAPSPIELLEMRGRTRQRARLSKQEATSDSESWQWGDER